MRSGKTFWFLLLTEQLETFRFTICIHFPREQENGVIMNLAKARTNILCYLAGFKKNLSCGLWLRSIFAVDFRIPFQIYIPAFCLNAKPERNRKTKLTMTFKFPLKNPGAQSQSRSCKAHTKTTLEHITQERPLTWLLVMAQNICFN